MKRFTDLYWELDGTTRTQEKLAALERYFREAEPEDAAWGLFFLCGRKLGKSLAAGRLRAWASEATGYPPWLIAESHGAVGDLSETVALLVGRERGTDPPRLSQVVASQLRPMSQRSEEEKRKIVLATWGQWDARHLLVWHKLISGSFRVGVSKTLVARALASVAGVSPAIMAHRLLAIDEPSVSTMAELLCSDSVAAVGQPYPFFLASPIDVEPTSLGPCQEWLAEWKWDGIRAQMIKQTDRVIGWSRGEELLNPAFPELESLGESLPPGTVIDGELLAWEPGQAHPLPFADLQHRLGRIQVQPRLWEDYPVVYLAFDLLEFQGIDQREAPLTVRRSRLASLLAERPCRDGWRLSPEVPFADWSELETLVASARDRGVEGVVVKRRTSPYRVGRVRGDWWKWKVDPYTLDAVLIQAQAGHGKRASLFTDYGFGVWHEGELVTIAKAYSGLTDEEIQAVDRFVRKNTTERHGPVRNVKPELVFELAFEGLQRSKRHKSGIALRFPRMLRWRTDKRPEEADSLATVESLLARVESRA